MKTTSALTLLAAGAILLFAVSIHLGFINLRIAGLVLIVTAAAGLSLRRRPGWARRQVGWLRFVLGADACPVDGARAPLQDLLGDPAGAGTPSAGESGSEDAPTLPDVWAARGVSAAG